MRISFGTAVNEYIFSRQALEEHCQDSLHERDGVEAETHGSELNEWITDMEDQCEHQARFVPYVTITPQHWTTLKTAPQDTMPLTASNQLLIGQ